MPSPVVFQFLSADGVDRVTSALFNVAFVWCNRCEGTMPGKQCPQPCDTTSPQRGQSPGHSHLFSPQASSGSSGEQAECNGGPTAAPGRSWADTDTAISLTAVIFLPPLFPSSILVSGTSIQWLKTQTFKLAWTLADLTFATSTSHQALPVFPPKYLWNRPSSLPSAGASWLEPLASHLSFWGSLLLGTRASGPAPLKSILCTAVRIILLKCEPGYPTCLKSN